VTTTGIEREDPEVDRLRQQLRSLGYLDAGVDRFVLAPARDTRRPLAFALLASLRIGLVAALLFGPTTAVAMRAQLPGFVTGVRDAVVLAVYMGALFGLALSVAAFAASMVVSWIASRAPRVAARARALALAAGVLTTVASLAYLTLWVRSIQAAAPASIAGGWFVAALAAAALMSALLGHAVTLAALALTVVQTRASPGIAGVPGGSRRFAAAAVLAAFGGALLLFNAASGVGAARPASVPLTVVSSAVRIRVFAIDGFDPALFAELDDSGRMPALGPVLRAAHAELRDLGAVPADGDVRDPARIWTTIATGQPPDVHGVHGLVTRRVAGVRGAVPSPETAGAGRAIALATDLLRLSRPSLASGTERLQKTFWEVAADAGLRTAVVNWWATWPAETSNGVVLTDRATLRLERGGTLDAEIAPPELYERLARDWPALRVETSGRARGALHASQASGQAAALLVRSAELDAIQLALTRQVADENTDLSVAYLPGLDIAQHALMAPDATLAPSVVAARLSALRDYYVALDRLLAPELTPGPRQMVVVITIPGRVAAGAAGLLAAVGGQTRVRRGSDEGQTGVRRGSDPKAGDAGTAAARATDVAPTILYALGVPISRELAGRPLVALFADEFVKRFPPREVATYGRPAAGEAPRTGQPLDQEMIDRLRSLGYVR
jgi:type I phosphodiesterase/nucleotide pyrophosphatase